MTVDFKGSPGLSGSHRSTRLASNFQESPLQTKPQKGPKRKVHMNFAHFCEFWCFFPWENKHDSHIELLFRNAPAKSS